MGRIKDLHDKLYTLGIQCQDPQYETFCSLESPCDRCIDDSNNDESLDPCIAFCYDIESRDKPCDGCIKFSNVAGGIVTPEEAQILHKIALKQAIRRNHGGI
jgi:hypothetical protein